MALIKRLSTSKIDYFHISLSNAWQKSRDQLSEQPVFKRVKAVLPSNLPLIVVGGLQTPKQVEDLVKDGADFAAIGKELICEPKWVQKVQNHEENQLHYKLLPNELTRLRIPHPFANYLKNDFSNDFPEL